RELHSFPTRRSSDLCLIATAGIVSGQAGGLYTAVVYVPAKSFKITKGTPCFYDTPSEAMGHNKRAFCAKCGSRLFGGITDEGQGDRKSTRLNSSHRT